MTSVPDNTLIVETIHDLTRAVSRLHSARLRLAKFAPAFMSRACSQCIRSIEDLLTEVKARQLQ